jgi:hypothetical protein
MIWGNAVVISLDYGLFPRKTPQAIAEKRFQRRRAGGNAIDLAPHSRHRVGRVQGMAHGEIVS